MPRLQHGTVVTESAMIQAREDAVTSMSALALAAVSQPSLHRFGYMFPALQHDPDSLLPETDPTATVEALRALAETMGDDGAAEDSDIPAAYTYFGQFVDHDITRETHVAKVDTLKVILDKNMRPLSHAEALAVFTNQRTATFDLDSLYGGDAPRDPANDQKMEVGEVVDAGDDVVPTKKIVNHHGLRNDVPRLERNDDVPELDRAARIGDPRNDENTIISQMQVAFLHAHNNLVDAGYTFEQARSILRQHYQHIVINDFLRNRIADENIVDNIVDNGNQFFDALSEPLFMPFEFSVAAYRFGHSMVRNAYDFNQNFNLGGNGSVPASLKLLFTFTAFHGELKTFEKLPDNWIIEWENIIGAGIKKGGRARSIDSRISAKIGGELPSALLALRNVKGEELTDLAGHLAARNLLRGYWMRMPTGQAVARLLGVKPLTEDELRAAVGSDPVGIAQQTALSNGGLLERTPLWFYVLAEAAGTAGDRLGPVGSTIVAEVLIGLVRRSQNSILKVPGWRAALPAKGDEFELEDLLRFAGVLKDTAKLNIHVVEPGETLQKIASKHLGDADRWPEIFAANRVIVRQPNVIIPGMRLIIPGGDPDPTLRFVVVERGDTLSSLAEKHLGDADRWQEILKLNGAILANPDVIIVGQVLQLPTTDRG